LFTFSFCVVFFDESYSLKPSRNFATIRPTVRVYRSALERAMARRIQTLGLIGVFALFVLINLLALQFYSPHSTPQGGFFAW
jgi:hypothetical protein